MEERSFNSRSEIAKNRAARAFALEQVSLAGISTNKIFQKNTSLPLFPIIIISDGSCN